MTKKNSAMPTLETHACDTDPDAKSQNPAGNNQPENGQLASGTGNYTAASNNVSSDSNNGVEHACAGDAFRVSQRSSSDAAGTDISTSLTNSQANLLADRGKKGLAETHRNKSQALFVRLDTHDEKLYRAYFRRQRIGTLPALVALATTNAVVQVTLDLVSSDPESKLDRLIVIPVSALFLWIFFFIALTSNKETVIASLEVASWLTLTFQLLYDIGTSDPSHVPSERLGLVLCLIFLSQMALPFSAWSSLPLVALLVLLHCLVTGFTWAAVDSNVTRLKPQMLGNALLCLACIAIGVSRGVFLDMLNRRSLLETKSALEAKGKIELAYKNKEKLLLSVLPKHVADEMLQDVGNLAPDGQFRKIYMSRYENVSILFADIVGFTAISSSVTAAALVKILNELFASFDVLAEKFHQTRIKILGDCYYCICGALEPRADHAVLTIHMGLSMVDAISSVRQKTGKDVNMRVGVHTGACLGGVLGQRQWQFDVLGKEVTLANKMESGGLPARVHISEITYKCLDGEFEVEDGHGPDREDELKLRNITTYLVKSVLKPYPQGTLDMEQSPGCKQRTTKNHSRDKKSRNSIQADIQRIEPAEGRPDGELKASSERKQKKTEGTDTRDMEARKISRRHVGGPHRADFAASLTRELTDMHSIRAVSKLMTPFTWRFKDDALEQRYRKRQENYSGLPLIGTSLALLAVFLAKLCVLPLSTISIALYLVGTCLLLVMAVITLAETFPARYPLSVVRYARTIRKSRVVRMLWALTAWAIVFICDTAPVHVCKSSQLNVTSAIDLDPDSEACEYVVYFCHAAVVLMLIVSSAVSQGHLVKGTVLLLLLGLHAFVTLFFLDDFYDYYHTRVYGSGDNAIRVKYRLLAELGIVVVALIAYNFNAERIARTLFYWKERRKSQKEEAVNMQERNTALVYNLLPAHVAREFSTTRRADSELYSQAYDEVGVMFAACPNFNSFYNESAVNNNGLECLRFLNEIISDYDELLNLAKFSSIVKIKTVGSTYMAASGMVLARTPQVNANRYRIKWSHLQELVNFALALQDVIKKINEQSFNNFILRIGINHGPIIAGVIGARKPHYDIWGNTVNVASRMESTGQAGKIQVVEECKEILSKFGCRFHKRGLVDVKGKGQLMTYFLDRTETEPSSDDGIPNQVPNS